MLISAAHAASETAAITASTVAAVEPPSATETFVWNMGLILVLVILFYVLLIMPQQKRFKEHRQMLDSLKKGDKVITGGGLVGKIDKITQGSDEVVIDLGNGTKVTALRSTIQTRSDALLTPAKTEAKKEDKKEEKKEDAKEKEETKKEEKKTETKKKSPAKKKS